MFEPSKYQSAIFEHVQANRGHARIDALAGSGKSTTAKKLLRFIPPEKRVALTAFNKMIADALAPEVGKYHANATAFTLHSFGYSTLRESFKKLRVDKYKNDTIMRDAFFDLSDRNQKSEFYRFKSIINRLITLTKAEGSMNADVMETIVKHHDLEIPSPKVLQIAKNVFEISKDTARSHGVIDFDDMVFGPMFYNLKPRQYDWMIVDEFQDFNMAQLNLVYAAAKSGTIITFGDPHQAIYGFAGAKTGVMDQFRDECAATVLPLSVCYRCPTNVIAEAQKIVPEIESFPEAIAGTVSTINVEQFAKVSKSGDVVLCRFTAPIVSMCLKFIRDGRAAFVKGKDLGTNLITLVETIGNLNNFNSYRDTETERLMKVGRPEQLETFDDKMDAIQALIEGSRNGTADEVISTIEDIFSDSGAGIMFSTIHKAKGLEFENVFILKSQKKSQARTEQQIQEEINLDYVAITRSKNNLYYVPLKDGKHKSFFGAKWQT